MKAHLFNKYLNLVFVETGTKDGNGVKAAIMAGFQKVISIEKEPDRYDKAVKMFEGNEKVILYYGDSCKVLFDIIAPFMARITFWLDANYNLNEPVKLKCPILCELEQIRKHPIKDHTLLIDDSRYYDTPVYNHIKGKQVKESILRINKNYRISRDTVRAAYPKDVIVAEAPFET